MRFGSFCFRDRSALCFSQFSCCRLMYHIFKRFFGFRLLMQSNKKRARYKNPKTTSPNLKKPTDTPLRNSCLQFLWHPTHGNEKIRLGAVFWCVPLPTDTKTTFSTTDSIYRSENDCARRHVLLYEQSTERRTQAPSRSADMWFWAMVLG